MHSIQSLLDPARLACIDNMSRFQRPYDHDMGFGVECRRKLAPINGEGLRIKHPGRPEIYFIDGGVRRLIPSDHTHSNLFFDFQYIIEVDGIDAIPEGPPLDEDSVLARASGEMPVFLVDRGMKRHIANPQVMATCHFNYFRVYQVPPILLRDIPTGEPIDPFRKS